MVGLEADTVVGLEAGTAEALEGDSGEVLEEDSGEDLVEVMEDAVEALGTGQVTAILVKHGAPNKSYIL